MTTRKYWIGVASMKHVEAAVKAGVFAMGPEKENAAARPAKGDWFAYYTPAEGMERDEAIREITAIGQIEDDEPDMRDMPDDGQSYSRRATYHGEGTADIYDLLDDFSFIKDKAHWGVHFHRSLLEVTKDDMLAIARKLNVDGRKL